MLELAAGQASSPSGTARPPRLCRAGASCPAFAKDGTVAHEFIYFHHLDNRAIRVGDWKLVAKGKDGPWELYDLKTDRCEQKNLAEQHPDHARDMSALWQRYEDRFRQQAGPAPEKPGEARSRKPNGSSKES